MTVARQAGDKLDVGESGSAREDADWTSSGLSAHLVVVAEAGAGAPMSICKAAGHVVGYLWAIARCTLTSAVACHDICNDP